jgi:DNA-binding FadR family transcriptional regulator
MTKSYLDSKSLMRTGIFKNQGSIVTYLLLKSIEENNEPLGSWALKASLGTYQLNCSTATIGRYLKDLDSQEFTVRRSNQGRVLTPLGKAKLQDTEELLARAMLRNAVSDALRINKFEDLIDLIRIRKILEIEAARMAAENSSEHDLQQLQLALEKHRQSVIENKDPTIPALDFHSAIMNLCHNRFMIALFEMVIFEEKRIESLFENLVTRERGSYYINQHIAIAEAITNKQPERASALMAKHLELILLDITKQSQERNGQM